MSFRDVGVPSVLLIDFHGRQPEGQQIEGLERWWHTADDNLAAMDKNALAMTGNLVMQALPDLQDFVLRRRKEQEEVTMRRSTTTVIGIVLALTACLSAALRHQTPAVGTQPNTQSSEQDKTPIDQKKVIALPAVKAPDLATRHGPRSRAMRPRTALLGHAGLEQTTRLHRRRVAEPRTQGAPRHLDRARSCSRSPTCR